MFTLWSCVITYLCFIFLTISNNDFEWLIDAFRLLFCGFFAMSWIVVRPKFQNRTSHWVELPGPPLPRSFEKRYKRNRVKSYLTLLRLRKRSARGRPSTKKQEKSGPRRHADDEKKRSRASTWCDRPHSKARIRSHKRLMRIRKRRKHDRRVFPKTFSRYEIDATEAESELNELLARLQHRFLHIPEWHYGQHFHAYCATFNPLDAYECMKRDFIQTTRVKAKPTANIASASLYVPGGSTDRPSILKNGVRRVFPVVLDTGASVSITPIASDFVEPLTPLVDAEVRGLNSTTKIHGIGVAELCMRDAFGQDAIVRTKAYHIPDAEVRLFSPQTYFQEVDGGSYLVTKDRTTLTLLDGSEYTFPYFVGNNLPMAFAPPVTRNYLSVDDLSELSSQMIAVSVVDETNANLTPEKRELIGWHWKLGHIGFEWL